MAGRIHTRPLVLVLLALFLGAALAAGAFTLALLTPAQKTAKDRMVWVAKGASVKDVLRGLKEDGLLRWDKPLLLWCRLTGRGGTIKAGEYRLNGAMSPLTLLGVLERGEVVIHPVTIPEGFTAAQIGEALQREGILGLEQFISAVKDPHSSQRLGLPGPTLEGYLFPDTYHFVKGQTPWDVIRTMVARFKAVTAPLLPRMKEQGLTLKELVTLASIVEKETGDPSEQPLVASVFLNRLKAGMPLQSDPTVIYGIHSFQGNLTREDLKRPGPYNTYRRRGLPPTPIANPGLGAIQAVLDPAETDYLYFVSKNDGTHAFSRTLAEHNRAVRRYQKKSP